MLRRLDVALNCVVETEDEIVSASNEDLERFAEAAEARRNLPMNRKKYIIDVPPVDEEFPSMAKTKTSIYPLPISHENQCTTVGLAGNLDKFTEEFSFHSQENQQYMPVRKSGKAFAIDKAYERFAFIKSLEKHKEQQAYYDTILRRTLDESSSEETQTFDEVGVMVEETVSSDSDED